MSYWRNLPSISDNRILDMVLDSSFSLALIPIDSRPAATGSPPAQSTAYGLAHLPLQFVHHIREDIQPLIRQLLGALSFRHLAITTFPDSIVRASSALEIPRKISSDFSPRLPAGNSNRPILVRSTDDPFAITSVTFVILTVANIRRRSAARALSDRRFTNALASRLIAVQTNHRLLAASPDLAALRESGRGAATLVPRPIAINAIRRRFTSVETFQGVLTRLLKIIGTTYSEKNLLLTFPITLFSNSLSVSNNKYSNNKYL